MSMLLRILRPGCTRLLALCLLVVVGIGILLATWYWYPKHASLFGDDTKIAHYHGFGLESKSTLLRVNVTTELTLYLRYRRRMVHN